MSAPPLFCPSCAEEDLVPARGAGGWLCRACTRAVVVTRLRGDDALPATGDREPVPAGLDQGRPAGPGDPS